MSATRLMSKFDLLLCQVQLQKGREEAGCTSLLPEGDRTSPPVEQDFLFPRATTLFFFLLHSVWQLSTLTQSKALFHFGGSDDVRALCILFCPCDPATAEPELSQLAAGAEIWLAVPGPVVHHVWIRGGCNSPPLSATGDGAEVRVNRGSATEKLAFIVCLDE